jgi:ribonuclease PH
MPIILTAMRIISLKTDIFSLKNAEDIILSTKIHVSIPCTRKKHGGVTMEFGTTNILTTAYMAASILRKITIACIRTTVALLSISFNKKSKPCHSERSEGSNRDPSLCSG